MSQVHPQDTFDGEPVPSRGAGYVGVASTDVGGGLAVARQQAIIRACAAAHGWQVAAVFTDRVRCRTARLHAMAAAHAGQYDVLLLEAQDRLSRHSDETMVLLADLGQTGVQIHCAGRCNGPARPTATPTTGRP